MADFVGQQVGTYRLKEKLGEGGFADVYLAEHVSTKKIVVAIKIAQDKLPEEAIQKFSDEASFISQLDHPHIVRLRHFELHNGLPYLVMDYFERGSLRKRHPKGTQLDLPTIVTYVKQISDALQYAHDYRDQDVKGIVHRDIKPDNILLKNDSTLLVSDFGIATMSYTKNYGAKNLDIGGTEQYMSPEHFRAEAQSASDQYSLAIVVYEWLCGTPPFTEGNFIQIGFQHTYVQPPPLHDEIAILPAVEEVVMKALRKDPKQRYASVTEFARALEEASKCPGESFYPSDVAQAICDCYLRSNRIANTLGAPINISQTDVVVIKSRRGTKGYKRPFTNGIIYWCERGGAQPTFLGFGNIHKNSGGVEGLLGFPLSEDLRSVPSPQGSTGSFQRFEGEEDYPKDVNTYPIRFGATTYWRRDDRYVYVVMGKIGECYERLHGTGSFLGFPCSAEKDIGPFQLGSTGKYQAFEGGSIYWKEGSSKAFPIGKVFEEFYHSDNDIRNRLGFPIESESKTITSPQGTAGKYQRFEGGFNDAWPTEDGWDHSKGVSVYWSKKYGAYSAWGGTGVCYEQRLGGVDALGFPITEEKKAAKSPQGTEGWYQQFEGGSVHWCGQYGGVLIIGLIHEAYKSFSGSHGKFGFPKDQQRAVPGQPEGSFMQEFEGGVICVYPSPKDSIATQPS